jgi:hypothetical protein
VEDDGEAEGPEEPDGAGDCDPDEPPPGADEDGDEDEELVVPGLCPPRLPDVPFARRDP